MVEAHIVPTERRDERIASLLFFYPDFIPTGCSNDIIYNYDIMVLFLTFHKNKLNLE